MGEYFHYANLDRAEYFDVGLGSQANKHVGIGRNFGARALGLLLLEGVSPSTGLSGTWAGQRVMVVGDEIEGGLYGTMSGTFRDIGSNVLLMLFAVDKEDLIEAARKNDALFLHLAELAVVHGAQEVAAAFARTFGPEWKKRYGLLRKERSYVVVPPP